MGILADSKKEYEDYIRSHPGIGDVVRTLRRFYEQCGAGLLYQPYEFGFNRMYEYLKSNSGELELSFCGSVPDRLHTKDGYIIVFGSHRGGDTDKFLRLLNQEFDTELGKHGRLIIKKKELKESEEIGGSI